MNGKRKNSRICEDYTTQVVYWLLKLEFLSSCPAADTEIRSKNKCEEMAFQRVSSSNELNSFSFCVLTFSLFFKGWFSQIQCSFLKISFCLSVFWSYYLTNFWISKFLLKNPLITWWNIPCIWQITSYFAFRIHSLSLTLDSLSITCLSMTLGFFSWRFFSFLYLCYFLRFGFFFFF